MGELTSELIDAYADALGYSDEIVKPGGAIRIPPELIPNPISRKDFLICKMKETIKRSLADKAGVDAKEAEMAKPLEIE